MRALSSAEGSLLLVVDMQPTFLSPIQNKDEVLRRTRFLVEVASVLGVPIISTVQYAERMGGTESTLAPLLGEPIDKLSFSCMGSAHFLQRLDALQKKEIVVCGIETHICVCQTVLNLLERSFRVTVPIDAVSARTSAGHTVALERMRNAGAVLSHTESIAYEWMGSAEHPRFRDVLTLVKGA